MIKYIISNTCFAMGDTKIVCHIFISHLLTYTLTWVQIPDIYLCVTILLSHWFNIMEKYEYLWHY